MKDGFCLSVSIGISYSIPRIEYRNAQVFKVPYISSDDGQIMLQGGRCDEAIFHFQRPASQFASSRQQSPALCYRFIHREDSALKPWPQSFIKPLPKLDATLAFRKGRNPFLNFAERNHAEIQTIIVSVFKPLGDTRLWKRAGHLGRDVRIEQKAIHSEASRPISRSPSKSRLRPLNGDSANNCVRLFLPSGLCPPGWLI